MTLQVLGISDFGIYSAVAGITSLLSVVTTSMSVSTQRFMTYSMGKGDGDSLFTIFKSSLQIHIALSFVLLLLAETIGLWFVYEKMIIPEDRLDVTFWVFQLSIFNCVIALLNVPYNAVIIAHEDMGITAVFAILQSVLLLIAVICLKYITIDKLLAYAALFVIVQYLIRIITVLYCKRRYRETHYSLLNRIDKKTIREMSGLAGWSILTNVAMICFTQGINILFNVFFGPLLNAAYTVAMQAYSGLRSFTSSFQLASNPQIVKLYSSGKIKEMHDLLYIVCKMSFFLLFFISFPFVLFRDQLLTIWLTEVPAHAANFFFLLFFYAYIDVICYPLDVAAQATGKIKWYSILTSVVLISVLPLNYIALKFGAIPESVYVLSILISVVGVIIRIYLLRNMINLSSREFFYKVSIPIALLLFSALPLPVIKASVENGSIWDLLIFVFLFIYIGASIFLFGLKKDEKVFMKDFILSKFRKK